MSRRTWEKEGGREGEREATRETEIHFLPRGPAGLYDNGTSVGANTCMQGNTAHQGQGDLKKTLERVSNLRSGLGGRKAGGGGARGQSVGLHQTSKPSSVLAVHPPLYADRTNTETNSE